jgi:GNAT superfamily N-acetyltransferase
MTGIITRRPRIGETEILRQIWSAVFGDEDVGFFFEHSYEPGRCIVALAGGDICSMAYLRPVGKLVVGDTQTPCAFMYGVATQPAYRGKGYGSAVVRHLSAVGLVAGVPAIALCPTSDGLFEYYTSRTCFREWFYVCERRFTHEQLRGAAGKCAGSGADTEDAAVETDTIGTAGAPAKLTRLAPEEYVSLREGLIGRRAHIAMDAQSLAYQDLLCSLHGGGLYKAETDYGDSCVIVEKHSDGTVWLNELLTSTREASPHESAVLSAVAVMYPASDYLVRTPAHSTADANVRRFAMLHTQSSEAQNQPTPPPWYGPAFD